MKLSNHKNQIAHGTFSLLNRVTIVGFGFLNVLLMVRMVSKEQIGVWVLYNTIATVIEMIRAGFIRNPLIITLVNNQNTQKERIIGSSLALHIVLAVSSSLLLLVSGSFLQDFWNAKGLATLFALYAVQNILLIAFSHIEYLQTAVLKFNAIFYCNFVRQVVPTILIAIMFFTNREIDLYTIGLFQILGVLLGSVLGYFFVEDYLKLKLQLKRNFFKELFHFGRFTLGTNISSTILRSTDSWMLGRLVSPAAVAIYNPALKLANLFEVPTMAISNFIFPQIAQRMKQSGEQGVREIYVKSVSLILALTIPMVTPLFIFSDFFIVTIFGPDYIEASGILKVTVLYSLIIPFNRQFGTTMDALKRPQLNFYLLVMATVLNIILNFIFLGWFGIIGCAYATLISYIILFIINQIVLKRMFSVNTLLIFPNVINWYIVGAGFITSYTSKQFAIMFSRNRN